VAGHVDVRTLVDAPLAAVWAAANDPAEWAGAGHPVRDVTGGGDRIRFSVTTPPDEQGRSFSYDVERTADERSGTVYSRRIGSPDFRYSHVWFRYAEAGPVTEVRCVVDFEMTDEAPLGDAEMAELMARGLRRNLTETARRIEGAGRGATDHG
jgi:aromatase